MNRVFFIALSCIALINVPCDASTITIKKGDTLTKIANENNSTVKEIMDANGIKDANNIKEGQKINLPIKSTLYKVHTVEKSQNLTQIATLYDTKKENFIALNKLENPDFLFEGQKLYIPNSNSISGDSIKEESNSITINEQNLFNEKDIEEGSNSSNIKNEVLAERSQSEESEALEKESTQNESSNSTTWKTYGPLKINWSSWKSKDGSFVANTIHKSGKPLFVAVNCSKKIINRTGKDGDWRDWIIPRDNFEKDLVNDLCNNEPIGN